MNGIMTGTPGVVTFTHSGRDQIYAFVIYNGRVTLCFFDASPNVTSWQWDDQNRLQAPIANGSPTALTSIQDPNAKENYLHVFVVGSDDDLYEHYWNGSAWLDWVNHGRPYFDVSLAPNPGAVATWPASYSDAEGWISQVNNRVSVFVWGGSNQLIYRYQFTPGQTQQGPGWYFQGNLPNPAQHVVCAPAVIKHRPHYYFDTAYAYVVGDDGKLYVNFSTNSEENNWEWLDLRGPNGHRLVALTKPGVVVFGNTLRAIGRADDFQLWAHSWGGLTSDVGAWHPLGKPPDTDGVTGEASLVTFDFNGTNYLYAFVTGDNGHLYVCRWDGGADLHWADFGRPTTNARDLPTDPNGGNSLVVGAPGNVLFTWDGTERIYVFVVSDDNHLHQCFWNGVDRWLWNDLGAP